jgi:hypothetical protein
MPIKTNLNVAPYFNDYTPSKKYYNILFKPGVSVQAREVEAMQSMMQNQIEAIGDNLFTTGTVISGCNFQYYNPYPYIKINDLDIFQMPTVPGNYVGLNLVNESNGLEATAFNFANGFQTTDPNLKTLYIRYNNTGNTGANLTSFSPGDTSSTEVFHSLIAIQSSPCRLLLRL